MKMEKPAEIFAAVAKREALKCRILGAVEHRRSAAACIENTARAYVDVHKERTRERLTQADSDTVHCCEKSGQRSGLKPK